jgi:hypothetical protein
MKLIIAKALWRLEAFARDLRRGLLYSYPLCCVLQYAWGSALRVEDQALRRGTIRPPRGDGWVPCRYHQQRDLNWRGCSPPYLPKE